MTTIDLISEIVSGLSYEIPIKTIVDNGDGTFTVNVCNTYHQTAGCKIILDGKNYRITEVITDTSITIKDLDSLGAPSITTFPVSAPFFRHGIAVDVNNEIVRVKDDQLFPMVYLYEKFTENYNHDPDSSIERTPALRLFCLDLADFDNWTIEDFKDNLIQAMNNLANELIKAFENDGRFGELTTSQRVNHPRFGIRTNAFKEEQTTWDKRCGGTELRIDLPIKFSFICNSETC